MKSLQASFSFQKMRVSDTLLLNKSAFLATFHLFNVKYLHYKFYYDYIYLQQHDNVNLNRFCQVLKQPKKNNISLPPVFNFY